VTVSAPRNKRSLLIIGGVVALLVLIAGLLYERGQGPQITIKSHRFAVEVADTDATRSRGLSGRPSIGQHQAMLFIYDQPGMRCFWMKDMRFSIDMVWLNPDKKVVNIERDISPATYPTNFCHNNAQYIVELAAGTAAQLHLQTGDTVQSTAW
jgi:uncharacterized membrane protein (UPF0127 family)